MYLLGHGNGLHTRPSCFELQDNLVHKNTKMIGTTLPHSIWLKEADDTLQTKDGKDVTVYELVVDSSDTAMLKAWAKHFREHYCLDSKIDKLRKGTGKSRAEYLRDLVFPDAKDDFGPATRSGDFAEILIADLLEGQLGYWVPRVRYLDKMVRNESPKGTDVLGFRFANGGPSEPSRKDVLIAFESKAQLRGTKMQDKLQDAVNDSVKDKFRIGESLNAIKRRLIDQDKDDEAERVERFQEGLAVPYVRKAGAAAVFCSSIFCAPNIAGTDCSKHENLDNLMLVVIHSKEFMKLVHALYERAAIEA